MTEKGRKKDRKASHDKSRGFANHEELIERVPDEEIKRLFGDMFVFFPASTRNAAKGAQQQPSDPNEWLRTATYDELRAAVNAYLDELLAPKRTARSKSS